MATYYIQISSAWQGSRWMTAYATNDRALAEYLAQNLVIEDNQWGQNNPGLNGRRYSRFVAKTKLARKDGGSAVGKAELDLAEGWTDIECPTRRSGRESHARSPWPHFQYANLVSEISNLIDLYHEDQAEKSQQGTTDFLLRDIPGPLHQHIKDAADQSGQTMRDLILSIL